MIPAPARPAWPAAAAVLAAEATPHVYSAALQAFVRRAGIRHFRVHEISDVGRRTWDAARGRAAELRPAPAELWEHIVPTLHVAEWIRSRFGDVPVHVSSGYRDPAYNRAVGGARRSLHVAFNAVDLAVEGHEPAAVATTLHEEFGDAHVLGIGLYEGFVHVDTRGYLDRPAPARWGVVERWWRPAA